jgi:uncharacterized membrane protein YfcA
MFIALTLLGIIIGFASGFFGIGGGTVLVPVLLLIGFDIKTAIGLAAMQMVFSSTLGSYVNYKGGKLILKDALFLGFGGFVGATQSGAIVAAANDFVLMSGFICILLFSLIKFLRTPVNANKEAVTNKMLLFLIGAFVGMVSLSMGIGGAVFLTPILVGFLGYDIKRAVSMGLFFVVFSSISGFLSMAWHGLIDFKMGLALGVGSLIGVVYGAKRSHAIEKQRQKWWLLGLYIVLILITFYELIGEL